MSKSILEQTQTCHMALQVAEGEMQRLHEMVSAQRTVLSSICELFRTHTGEVLELEASQIRKDEKTPAQMASKLAPEKKGA